ncbi:MAG: hypothetical protein L0H41_13690 [Microlunatus sp.]|nr:hypothetical protein [Microlunatus sp.]
MSTTPQFGGKVPTPKKVLGFELGSQRATTDQIDRYVRVVGRSSDHVVSGTFGRTARGTKLPYALLSNNSNLSPARLKQISADAARLREPGLSASKARVIKQRMPLILWMSGNVHGNEPSGADANLRMLYELADRTDCVATTIRKNALVGFIPTQNPDGRNADTRENSYAFDMNRDWFARTQPETATKLDLLEKYPPQLYVDEHEMGGSGYFFPPNSDPVYHETSQQSLNWINNVYGSANAGAFVSQGIDFETFEAGFDLFFQGFGDTTPTTRFGAAGMTFEAGGQAEYSAKTYKHYLSGMTSLYAGASRHRSILNGWHATYKQAARQGKQCLLQPNKVYNPGNTVQFEVPNVRVCGYFLRSDDRSKRRDLATTVSRLQQAGVQVQRLTKPVRVPDYRAYGRSARATVMPTGTYWISMNQAQKHWIQAMLNEDTYVPFPYFYDVSGWSEALTANLTGGYTGAKIADLREGRALEVLPPQRVPRVQLPSSLPRVGILSLDRSPFRPSQSAGWLRWRLDRDWKIPRTTVNPTQVNATTLARFDVLLAPDGRAQEMQDLMGTDGQEALRTWVNSGGHYIGWAGGAELATSIGLSTAVLENPTGQAPGTLFRAQIKPNSAFTTGVGQTAWVLYDQNSVMRSPNPANVIASYPAVDSPDWYVSGFQKGAEELGTTAAEISEPVGTGQVTVFSIDPNYRAQTNGTAKLLYNAMMTSRGVLAMDKRRAQAALEAGSAARAKAETRAEKSAQKIVRPVGVDLAVTVAPQDLSTAKRVLRAHGANFRVEEAKEYAVLVVDGGRRAPLDPAPWTQGLAKELTQAGAPPIDITVP